MTIVDKRPTLSAPGEWDRYYQVHTDLGPLIDTSGLPTAAFGENVLIADSPFAQSARRGFFLTTTEPLREDPAAVSAALAGVPQTGAFASISGTRLIRARRTATGIHGEFEQLVRGAPVAGGNVRLHSDESGVFAITGSPVGDLSYRDPGPAPLFDNSEALQTCAERFEIDDLHGAQVTQVVFPEAEGATWAYEVGFFAREHAADVLAYLRAGDLSLLLSFNISSAQSRTNGRAHVYMVNPMQTPDLVEVTLDGLDAPGNLLRGAMLDVSQAAGARIERDDADFRIDPAASGFDEPQAYHSVWRAAEYFRAITAGELLDAKPFTPLTVLVNDPAAANNAYYAPRTGELRFGLFGSRSSARSASVVIHEFGHAVTDGICQLGRSYLPNTEARGLSEGFSDYFAASLLDDPRLGDYVAGDPHGVRNCADAGLRFAEGFRGEEHETGGVWAAVLWAARVRLGQELADRLAIESLDFLGNTSTFEDARAALHLVDAILHEDANQHVIDEEFEARMPT